MTAECGKLPIFVEKNSAVILAMKGQIGYTVCMGKSAFAKYTKGGSKGV